MSSPFFLRLGLVVALLGTATAGCSGSSASSSESAAPPAGVDAGLPGVGHAAPACAEADLQTSGDHCGRCDHSCLGGACEGGACGELVVAEPASRPFRVQATEKGLAWLTVKAVEIIDTLGARAQARTVWETKNTTRAFAVGSTFVVVATDDGDVWRMRRDGSDALRVASGQDRVMSIRARGDVFYWATFGKPELTRLDAAGKVDTLATDTCGANDLVLSGDRAIVTSGACRALIAVPLGGGSSKPLAQSLDGWNPVYAAERDGTIAWVNWAGKGGVLSTDAATGETKALLELGQKMLGEDGSAVLATAIALDEASIYFSTDREEVNHGHEGGYVYALPRAGGAKARLSTAVAKVQGIAVNDDALAWTHWDYSGWSIRARAK